MTLANLISEPAVNGDGARSPRPGARPPPLPRASAPTEPPRYPQPFAILAKFTSVAASLVVHTVLLVLLALLAIPFDEPPTSSLQIEAAWIDDVRVFESSFDLSPLAENSPSPLRDVESRLPAPEIAAYTALGEDTIPSTLRDNSLESTTGQLNALFDSRGEAFRTHGDTQNRAEFFGVTTIGNSFVFVVDRSNSMRGTKWIAAKRELLLAIKRLKASQRFYVVFFANGAYAMFDRDHPAPSPIPATRENISKLEYWIATVENEFKTLPLESMKHALKLRPDAIYFLTDGRIQDKTEEFLRQENISREPIYGKRPVVIVNTIGFGVGEGQDILARIAQTHGGTYRRVLP